MAVIAANERIAQGVYRMRIEGAPEGQAGQFVMLRAPGRLDPFLGRPISLYDSCGDELTLVYQIAGRGTSLFAGMQRGQTIDVQGPYGNGFPLAAGDAALIGGGIGSAPMHLLAKVLRKKDPARRIDVYLGFREEAYLEEAFARYADHVHTNIGGFVTRDVDFARPATFYACGPSPMLRAAAEAARAAGAKLYVSLEKRMACGAGACLGCSIKTSGGNRRVCKDGPVFDAREVNDVL